MNSHDESTSTPEKTSNAETKEALAKYRILLAEKGEAYDQNAIPTPGKNKAQTTKKSKGFSKAEVAAIIENKGELSLIQLLRCKARYFTAGFAVGSEIFVDHILQHCRKPGGIFEHRKTGTSKLKHATGIPLSILRNLQKSPIQID